MREDRVGHGSSLRRVQEALARLRSMESCRQMIDTATSELCRTFGFDRAVMFRVSGSELVGLSVHIPKDPAWAQELLELTDRVHLPLKHMLFETEMLRRRRGMMLLDAPNDPRAFKPLVDGFRTRSYVAAPIMPSDRVIGFLHADHYYEGRDVDDHDLDVLGAYAEGFGFAFERTSLLERVRAQREHATRLMSTTSALMDDVCHSEVQLVDEHHEMTTALHTPSAPVVVAPDSRLASLLTRRELEVLQLMADGHTNGGIATRLVISEGTVKSHVGHVLRKMRAANRAEAVSRYLRMAQRPEVV
ncbi:LuxR C-terminal-related transcriptional regulator [Paraconexibacter sp.]|uniref:LuxR C-terminal-related transcriptional regulator n=1 Tax=Paraconexibacter sp. TaxID=2949640 RepID=UPI003566181B